MPINKIAQDADAAVERVTDGAVVLVGGFGTAGAPTGLLGALARRGLRDLTVVSNNAGAAHDGMEQLLLSGSVRKMVCSYPKAPGSVVFPELYTQRRIELELVAQGTLSERIRAAGAGVSAFFVRTSAGTDLAAGKEQRVINGQPHVLETALHADLALIRAARGDRWGNLTYRKSGRNFGPSMATAAAISVAEVDEVVELGTLDPESVVTPGIFVDWVVVADDRGVEVRTRSRPRSASTCTTGRTSTWASACRPWSPTTCPPTAKSSSIRRTAFWAWCRPPAGTPFDPDLINAGKQAVALRPGGCSSATRTRSPSFAAATWTSLSWERSRSRQPGIWPTGPPARASLASAGPWTWSWAYPGCS